MNKDLTTGNLVKILPAFTLPLILSAMLQQMFNWVDAFIVGNFAGETALAGIGATHSLYNLFIMIISGFSSGLAVLIGQSYGKDDHDTIRSLMAAFSTIFAGLMVIVAVLGSVLMDPVLLLLDTPAQILPDAATYLRVIFAGVPFLAVYNVVSVTLRGIGNSKAPFYAILVSSVCNVFLDLLFVAGFGMGVFGAAVATAAAQMAMTVFIVFYAFAKYPFLRIRFSD
ncbi:MAG: polysaccharide biosynthesis C-terminal domain-containing protein, partial [Firmicutes bacterium]|nr:polysaccharide biosynthesis C-terminal domain-containing protein [Bacillota bacterium]